MTSFLKSFLRKGRSGAYSQILAGTNSKIFGSDEISQAGILRGLELLS